MKLPASKLLPPLLALALSMGLAVHMRTLASTVDTDPFHKAVRDEVELIPAQPGNWEGTDVSPPAAAGTLLRPNSLFGRRYRDPVRNRWATLIFIHCRDSRDMSGHYPPNCYRGSGWTQVGPPRQIFADVWGRQVPVAEYAFTRSELERTIRWTVYDLFVLPAGGIVTDMTSVQIAGGDYRSRPYGAAQIQVIVDSGLPEAERLEIVDEMLELLGPVVERLQSPPGGKT